MLRGRFINADIATAPEQAGEKQAALFGHYAIGIVLALFYVVAARWLGVRPDSLFIALGYGFATTVFPWLLVLPALGFGAFGLQGPPGLKLFRTSLLNHGWQSCSPSRRGCGSMDHGAAGFLDKALRCQYVPGPAGIMVFPVLG
jgi:hypothetical protein